MINLDCVIGGRYSYDKFKGNLVFLVFLFVILGVC